MRGWLAQFREIGVPRCRCGGLILPWQDWVCEIEDWPQHHSCFHAHVAKMLAFVRSEDYGEDDYGACRFCHRTTDSGFATEALG